MRIRLKKLISITLALSLTLALLPVFSTTAYAARARSSALDLTAVSVSYHNGTTTTTGNPTTSNILNCDEGWKWYLTAADGYSANTLVLNGLSLSANAAQLIVLPGGSRIVLADGSTNTVSNAAYSFAEEVRGIASNSDITFSGEGSLTITTGSTSGTNRAVYSNGKITLGGGTITATTGSGSTTYGTSSRYIAINGGIITLSATAGTGYGVYLVNGESTPISGGSVTVIGNTSAFYKTPGLPASYTAWSNTATTNPGGSGSSSYTWNSSHRYVKIINRNTVSFNNNGGAGGQSGSVSVTYGAAMPTISTTAPTRTGHTFGGWYDNSASTGGTQYYTVAGASARTWNKTADTTLYARWTAYTYSVKFNANGGSGTMSNQSHTYGSSLALTANSFGKAGYTFMGWDTDSAGTTVVYTDGESVSNLTSADGATVNLYAVWSINSRTLTIDFHGGDDGTEQITRVYGTQCIITNPTRNGYIFDGWTLAGGGTIADNGNGTYTYTFADSNGTIKAQWISTRQTGVSVTDSTGYFNVTNSNLDVVIEEVIEPNERDKVVSLTLNVTDNADPTEVEAIKTAASGGSEVYFFDATLTKTVDGAGIETLSNVSVPVEIHIELDGELAGKTYYRVYRYHDGKAEQISSDTSRAEHYTVDVANSEIIIRTMKFSTYAIFGNDAPIDLGTGYDVDVQAKITGTGGAVYKIDLAWGAMTFEYSTSGVWDAVTHSYKTSETVGWLKEGFMNGNNQITAWNHSNGDVNVSFEITQESLDGVTMQVNQDNEDDSDPATGMPLEKVQSQGAEAEHIDAFLRLKGKPNNPNALNADYSKIAVITVTITAAGGGLTPNQ